MSPPSDRLRLAYLGDPNSVHLRRWAGFFAERGHRVHLLVPRGLQVRPGLHPAIELTPFTALPAQLTPAGVWSSRRDLRRLVRAIGAQVIHAHYARHPAWHAWLSGARPYLLTVWGSDVLVTRRMTRTGRLATLLALRQAALVTAASEALADAAVRLGARPERVRRVQFGVDLRRFRTTEQADEAVRQGLGLGPGPVVLSPRALAPLYRHDTVLEAVAGLPADTTLLAMSTNADTAYRARIEAMARELGLADRLRILPPVSDEELPLVFRAADVVISVPESDGVPASMLEAMATGRPVVASDLPGVRDWLGDLTPELLVPVGDAASARRALETVLSAGSVEREAIARRLRSRIEERASEETNMGVVEGWYRELAADGGRS